MLIQQHTIESLAKEVEELRADHESHVYRLAFREELRKNEAQKKEQTIVYRHTHNNLGFVIGFAILATLDIIEIAQTLYNHFG